jgi:pimeloyl-ACP methyl ester carboxylesterase
MVRQPETRYAKGPEGNIAYQVVGDGPMDLVVVPGWFSHVDMLWGDPGWASFVGEFASFARVILYDKRGTGLSDPVDGVLTLESRVDDLRAVLDAAGSERAALFGFSEGGPISVLFAASYPERVIARCRLSPGSCCTGYHSVCGRFWPWLPRPLPRYGEKAWLRGAHRVGRGDAMTAGIHGGPPTLS